MNMTRQKKKMFCYILSNDVHNLSISIIKIMNMLMLNDLYRPGEGQTDCYLPTDCVGKPDGSYPDTGDGCISYYRCFRGIGMGRFYCPMSKYQQ